MVFVLHLTRTRTIVDEGDDEEEEDGLSSVYSLFLTLSIYTHTI